MSMERDLRNVAAHIEEDWGDLTYMPTGQSVVKLLRAAAKMIENVRTVDPLTTEKAALIARIRELEAALRTYAAHRPSCPRSVRPPGAASCTCGLYDLLEGSPSHPDNLSTGTALSDGGEP